MQAYFQVNGKLYVHLTGRKYNIKGKEDLLVELDNRQKWRQYLWSPDEQTSLYSEKAAASLTS